MSLTTTRHHLPRFSFVAFPLYFNVSNILFKCFGLRQGPERRRRAMMDATVTPSTDAADGHNDGRGDKADDVADRRGYEAE
jgi:hypothetical protein